MAVASWLMTWIVITFLEFTLINIVICFKGTSNFTSLISIVSALLFLGQIIMIIAGAFLFFHRYNNFSSETSN